MTDQRHAGDAAAGLDAALKTLAAERQRLARLHEQMTQGVTTTSKDRMVSVTMNGRGEIVKLAFGNTRYRQMAPAELAAALTETIAAARTETLSQLTDLSGDEILPGLSFRELADGRVSVDQVVNSFLGAALNALPPHVMPPADRERLRGDA